MRVYRKYFEHIKYERGVEYHHPDYRDASERVHPKYSYIFHSINILATDYQLFMR
jgi:hypothetical protein